MSSTIYLNGSIITVDENIQNAEAVFTKDGVIEFVGTKEEALNLVDEDTVTVDLEGKTMLPGFIDAHGHIGMMAPFMSYKNVSAPPNGGVTSIKQMIEEIKEFIVEKNIPEGEWVVAYGYDTGSLDEVRHPNKFDLDQVSTKHKVFVAHASMHMAAVNTLTLEAVGYDENSVNPQGGVIERVEGTNEPNGFLEETAMLHVFGSIPQLTKEQLVDNFEETQLFYASRGITTAQEGFTLPNLLELCNANAELDRMPIDVIAYPAIESELCVGEYKNGFRVGGAKLLLDGSPQGKTAWLTKPYHVVPDGQTEDYCGYPMQKEEFVYDMCKKAIENKIQLLTHTNGDAAIDQFLDCYERALKDTGSTDDLRPVLIHAQTIREDQIDRVKNINAICSYFVDHTFFWGDWHIDSVLGEERAFRISPIKTTIDKGVMCTTHQDPPVIPPNMIRSLNSAVNRVTRSGRVCGENERVNIMEAIKLLTINGAYQYFEENVKGTITPGKIADFVILDKNPLTVESMDIKDIEVVKTIKRDKVIYSK